MKCFRLDDKGDVVIDGRDIALIYDDELLAQKIRQVFLTNYGEWAHNPKEGIKRSIILKKNPSKDEVRSAIRKAIRIVDKTLLMKECTITENRAERSMDIRVVIGKADGTDVRMEISGGGV